MNLGNAVQQEATDKILTIPNLLTLVRLLLLPVFFVLLVQYHNNELAFVVLVSAAVTDFVDGAIARATKTVSKLGQRLDPLVDRVFIIIGVIAVFVAGRVPFWVLLVLILRDAVMLWVTIHQKRRYGRGFKVVLLGKVTTALLMAGFCSLVLMWPLLPGAGLCELGFLPGWGAEWAPLGIWLIYLGVITSLITAAYYLYRGTHPDLPVKPSPEGATDVACPVLNDVEDVRGS